MTTTIQSNGSRWAGQAPASVDELLDVLARETLDPTFEKYGNFILRDEPPLRFWGNFFNVSHVFSIDTDDPALIDRLTSAIRANQQRPDYQAARAAAAVPALLAALEAMMSATFLVPPSQEIINARDIARAAIRAARGEE